MSDIKLEVSRGCYFVDSGNDDKAEVIPSSGCNKLDSYDWLKDIDTQSNIDVFEIRFKNTRKGYFQNVDGLALKLGDIVAVEAAPGHDIGIISSTKDMVCKQMRRTRYRANGQELKKIYRKAKSVDIVKWQRAISSEHKTMISARRMASSLNLNMKIGDVEFQGDGAKAIFYYIADERVDFRELIKVFAEQFKVRIEMKQIGARQEAGRIGGLGSCGRELCCSKWVSNFVSVTTSSARFQEISLNPQKLAGQCGKLKCCLNYEVDSYIDHKKRMPRVHMPLETLDAQYHLVKSDILRGLLMFSSDPYAMANVITIDADRVREIISLNKKGVKPKSLDSEKNLIKTTDEHKFTNVVGEDSITRFDSGKRSNRNKNGRNNNNKNRDNNSETNVVRQPKNANRDSNPETNVVRQSKNANRDSNPETNVGRQSKNANRDSNPETNVGRQPKNANNRIRSQKVRQEVKSNENVNENTNGNMGENMKELKKPTKETTQKRYNNRRRFNGNKTNN